MSSPAEPTAMEACLRAIRDEMRRDERVFVIGENSGITGSLPIFKGLPEEFGERVVGTPICEGSVTNAALGAALTGLRPIVALFFADFMMRAMDELVSQVARVRYTLGGQGSAPMVIRAYDGVVSSSGTQHSGSYEGMFASVPGLKVVIPGTPRDAMGLMTSAIRDDDPVIYLEHKRLLAMRGAVPDGYVCPIGAAEVQRPGGDVSVVCYGIMVSEALAAAERLADEDGIDVEVVDVRTLAPLDLDTILASARRTGRVVVATEATRFAGFGAELSASVAELAHADLRAPVARVGSADTPVPFSPPLEQAVTAGREEIAAAVRRVCADREG
jgi:pyruvate dehydrogenase E1 component beta subunit